MNNNYRFNEKDSIRKRSEGEREPTHIYLTCFIFSLVAYVNKI